MVYQHGEFNVYVSRCCFGLIRPQDSWEIVRGLREGVDHVPEPPKHEGEILKKRRWPLKGYNTVRANTRGVLKKAHSVHGGRAGRQFRQSVLLTRAVRLLT